MTNEIASRYIRENFELTDRLALVLLNKYTSRVLQHLASADRIASDEFQAWLRERNDNRWDAYISMNALYPQATGRTKADVAVIRHIYLDFDVNGTESVERLLGRPDLPTPNYRINTSPGKWQVVWKVEGFDKPGAEQLQRAVAREAGADPAATDCARVLRLPGLHNHKYGPPYAVTAETLASAFYRRDQFPTARQEELGYPPRTGVSRPSGAALTQSERDWSFAKRALARGDSPESVIAAIASYRRYDKPNPPYYAELTVRKAAEALKAEMSPPIERG